MAAELSWIRSGLPTNYHVILDLRNECAVAALALHQWSLYQMCISDRYRFILGTELYNKLSESKVIKEAAIRSGVSVGVMPVSYTHLSLPRG